MPENVPSLYEWAGGLPALNRLTERFYQRVRDDATLTPNQPAANSKSAPVIGAASTAITTSSTPGEPSGPTSRERVSSRAPPAAVRISRFTTLFSPHRSALQWP
jgi:hypothetical protein